MWNQTGSEFVFNQTWVILHILSEPQYFERNYMREEWVDKNVSS